MKQLTLLGSTGSIGISTLEVVRANPDLYQVLALVAHRNTSLMLKQCEVFRPSYVAMTDKKAANALRQDLKLRGMKIAVLSGMKAACELASLGEADLVMQAIVGTAALLPTLAAIRSGKTILLANKESLVSCGRIFMDLVKKCKARLLPVDSEHNAIFQSLPYEMQLKLGISDLEQYGISSIILTGSGGPFRDYPLDSLADVSPDQACTHPNWSMGRKISIDSATMMNKGLEYIEARWLFNASQSQIEVILHPQSVIHSMVRYSDGSILAQLGTPDMRIPISHSMAWPSRICSGAVPLDFTNALFLTFAKPDLTRYPCLNLAIEACEKGQGAATILNATNEVAVNAFLNYQIRFTDIAAINDEVLTSCKYNDPDTVEAVLELDHIARARAKEVLPRFTIL